MAEARGRTVWRTDRRRFDRNRPRGAPRRLRASELIPVALILAVASGCITLSVFTMAQRADETELDQQRRLFATALAARRTQVLLQIENVATSNLAVQRIWAGFDPTWTHVNVGLRLKTLLDLSHAFVVDSFGRLVYAQRGDDSVDPEVLDPALDEIATLIDDVRARRQPPLGEELEAASIDPVTNIMRPPRAARIQAFMGHPAIVAAVPVSPQDASIDRPRGPAPVIVAVSPLDGDFLDQLGQRLRLKRLRVVEPGSGPPLDREFSIVDDVGGTIAQFAWLRDETRSRLARNVLPFLAVASGCFLLLGGFLFRYMRRTAATIAAGEDRLRHLTFHDPLSGLPNRAFFGERLGELIKEVRLTGSLAAVLSIDLDRFKDINDTLGHLVGDALIRAVALRLVRTLRDQDLIARLGGDEFAVLTTGVADIGALQAIAERIIETLRAPFRIMGHPIVTGASMGIALITPRSGEAADIMRCADVALYRAKNDGRNRVCLHDVAMDADLRARKQLENDLREAIERQALSLAFQPIVTASGERTVGVEALCRWQHPSRGEILPSEFIPIAEHSELIIPLGDWVLRQACREAAAWPALSLAVNVSPLQFRRPDFVDVVERILAETGFSSARLELELTESTLIGNVEDTTAAMQRLKSLGVRFALDDFGTGYSSLLYLRTFPFDKLKIDRSFVGNIENATDAAAIVHAIVSLGRGLGMKVTAEGVETADQHLFLRAAGVHTLQGYRFGGPVSAQAMAKRIAGELPRGTLGPAAVPALAG
jgi:diguanylate cyclase